MQDKAQLRMMQEASYPNRSSMIFEVLGYNFSVLRYNPQYPAILPIVQYLSHAIENIAILLLLKSQ
jgi:hypothetical protein